MDQATQIVSNENNTTPRMDWQLWRQLFAYALPYRQALVLIAVFAVATAGIETAFPLLTKAVIDAVAAGAQPDDLYFYGGLYLGLMVALALAIVVFIFMAGQLHTHVSHDLRRAGFANLQRLSFSFYDRHSAGWLLARMTSDCERLSDILAWGLLDLIWGSTLMIGIAIAMLILNPLLGLLVLAVIPPLIWVSIVFRVRILGSARAVREHNSRITAAYNEAIVGVRTSKVFVREGDNLDEFRGLSGAMHAVSVRNARQAALYLPVVMALGSLATGLALAAGGYSVVAGGLSIGTLIAFISYSRHFFEPIEELASWFAQLQSAQAAAERVLGLINTEAEIKDSPAVLQRLRRAGKHLAGVAPDGYPERISEIEFRQVGFAYRTGETVLRGIELTVRAGETVALVGATGSGKTTLVNLLCRFYEPSSGQILIDGVDYRQRGLHWLQSNLGMVLQNAHIFGGTVLDNIRYGDLSASDEAVVEAAKLAGAHEFIVAMEQGYHSTVGEDGQRLSAGQKQLLSFARAILADARIVVLDEATSAVDSETEQRIQQGLGRVLAGRIGVVIAHRLSTIRAADRIVVLEHGRIVEQGSHRELMALGGYYHELFTRQSLRDVVDHGERWRA